MGTVVYRARDTTRGQDVVLEVVAPEVAARTPQYVSRFLEHATTLRTMALPGLATVLDVLPPEGGEGAAVVTEWLDGRTLDQAIAGAPLAQALAWLESVVAVVAAVHVQGVVHTNLAPSNVVLLPDGRVKLKDFTQIHMMRGAMRGATPVEAVAFGYFPYKAPEAFRTGQPVDERADVYSLGAMYYEVLTGKPPTMRGTIESPARARPEADPRLAELVMACLAEQPEGRPRHAVLLQQALAALRTPAPGAMAGPVPTPTPSQGQRFETIPFSGYGGMGPAGRGHPRSDPTPTGGIGYAPTPFSPGAQPAHVAHTPVPGVAASAPASGGRTALIIGAVTFAAVGVAGAAYVALRRGGEQGALAAATAVPPGTGDQAAATVAPPAPTQHELLVELPSSFRLAVQVAREGGGAAVDVPFDPGTAPRTVRVGLVPVGNHRIVVRQAGVASGPVLVSAEVTVGASAPPPLTFTDPCPSGMVFVPGGTFQMGSDVAALNAAPPHEVTVAPFCIDRTERTVGWYRTCATQGRCGSMQVTVEWDGISSREREAWSRACAGTLAGGDALPMTCADWSAASGACGAEGARLPTEAEWEFAARGEDGRSYPWGPGTPGVDHGNFCGAECVAYADSVGIRDVQPLHGATDAYGHLAPVASFPGGQSPYGVHDLSGNVWEWVADAYAPYVPGAASNPTGPTSGEHRVLRGGGWNDPDPNRVHASFRFWLAPGTRSSDLGFRCARPIPR